jgi:hypothetical protein
MGALFNVCEKLFKSTFEDYEKAWEKSMLFASGIYAVGWS